MKNKPQNRSLPRIAVSNISGIRTILNSAIQAICKIAPYFCNHPKSDFTWIQRLPFELTIKQVLAFQNETLQNELFDFFANQDPSPTKSALILQRHKIKTEVLIFIPHYYEPSKACKAFLRLSYLCL